MSRGRGRFSRSRCVGAVSSSSMISLQRSMHSSQMYTPGPAISFLTCRWLLPQKLQSSCSLLSVGRAMRSFGRSPGPKLMLRDHSVNDPVVLCLFRGHEVVALVVRSDLVVFLLSVLSDDLVETSADIDDLFSVNLDIGRLTLETARNLVDEDLRVGQ